MKHFHFFISVIGTGFAHIAEELQEALIDKNDGDQNSVASLGAGAFKIWDRWVSEEGFLEKFINEKLPNFVSLNPNVTDFIISGPGAVLNYVELVQRYPNCTLYFVDRVSNDEVANQASMFFAGQKNQDSASWETFTAKMREKYDEAVATHSPSFTVYKSFFYDLDSDQLEVEPSGQTTLSYLKRVGIVRF